MQKFFKYIMLLIILNFIVVLSNNISKAYDTDIYKVSVRPNVMILFDSSGSMGYGVYEHTVDYGAFYDWASELGDCDVIAGGCGTYNSFYHNHFNRNEILLVKGNIGVTIKNSHTFTGDPGDPEYVWYTSQVIHTNTIIDENGNLHPLDSSKPQRLTVSSDGTILLDGEPLPLDRGIKLHEWQINPDGSKTDKGFGGLLNAPGWYFSGFSKIGKDASDHVVAKNGDKDIYFFVTGNWMNMQQVYNLETSNGQKTWQVRTYNGYKMERRIDVVRDGIIYVINHTRGKINWGLAKFSKRGNGAKILQPLNPSLSDDKMRQNIITQLNKIKPYGGTPLGESLQDIYNHFHKKQNLLPPCSTNYVIIISDGYPSDDNDWRRISGVTFSDWDNDGWTEDPYQYSNPPPDYMDDVAHWMYTHSIKDKSIIQNPTDSSKNIIVDALGFMLNSPLLKDTALDGGGMFLTAFNKQQLINALYSLGLVISANASFVAPVVPINKANRTENGDYIYFAFFKPMENGRWIGNLKKFKLSQNSNIDFGIFDSKGNLAVDTNGNFLSSATSYWSSEADGGDVEKGGAAEVLRNTLLNTDLDDPYSTRNIYVIESSNLVRFLPQNVTKQQLGVDTDDEKYKLVNYIYGYLYADDGSSNHYPIGVRKNVLGSIIHSNPVVINYGNNKTYIVVGANDGMLHVFNDKNGEEVAAFIPGNLLSKLKNLTDQTIESPLFYVDGPITYFNNYITGSKTLIFGERRGGTHYYALNITNSNPTNWSVEWVISPKKNGFSELSQTWSKIVLSKIRTSSGNKYIGIFDGGYDPKEDDGVQKSDDKGRAIYVIDINTGNLLYSYSFKDNKNMKYCIPSTPSVIEDEEGYLKAVIFSDIYGQIWRMDYNESTYTFSPPKIVFKTNTSSTTMKTFYSPDVTYVGNCGYKNVNRDDYFIFFGTGDREHPLKTNIINRIYGVTLPNNLNSPLTENDLLDLTDDKLDKDSGASNTEKETIMSSLINKYGWYVKLSSGEKVLSKPTIFDNIVYFTTYTPSLKNICNPQGISKVYALKYCNATAGIDYNTNNDTNNSEKFDKSDRSKIIGKSISPEVIVITKNNRPIQFYSGSKKVAKDNITNLIFINWRQLFEE